jgi:hypothetical protein
MAKTGKVLITCIDVTALEVMAEEIANMAIGAAAATTTEDARPE